MAKGMTKTQLIRAMAERLEIQTKQRSLFAIAGSLLAEISLPKLILAWLLLIILPGILLGLAPLVASGWFGTRRSVVACWP